MSQIVIIPAKELNKATPIRIVSNVFSNKIHWFNKQKAVLNNLEWHNNPQQNFHRVEFEFVELIYNEL